MKTRLYGVTPFPRVLTIIGLLVCITIPSLHAESWYAGTWDASGLPVINGHPTTVALRVEVLNAESGIPLKGAEVQLEGEWVDQDGLTPMP